MAISQDEVLEKVTEVLVDALGVDDDEVSMSATLVGDLGAESIDFLDIVFRLEKTFGIKIEQSEMFPDNVLTDEQYVTDGSITDKGLEEISGKMPHLNIDALGDDHSVENFSNLFTVEAVVKFVQAKTA